MAEKKKEKASDDDSDASSDSSDEEFQWLLHVTFTALDPVYGAELCSHTTYTDDSLVGPARFKDVIGVDASGRPVIDWHAFDDHVDGCDHDVDDDSSDDDDFSAYYHRSPLDEDKEEADLGNVNDSRRKVHKNQRRAARKSVSFKVMLEDDDVLEDFYSPSAHFRSSYVRRTKSSSTKERAIRSPPHPP